MGQFLIDAEVFTRFPGLTIPVAVAHGVDNAAERPDVQAAWQSVWTEAAHTATYGNAQSYPRVKPWRDRFTAMGVSGKQFPSSIEAILRRALKGGEPFRINPLVDFYNTLSLRHVVTAGGFDLADMQGPLELRLSRSGDQFVALDDDTRVDVPAGEVSYATGQTILTRHFVWRQSRAGLLTPATRDVVLMAEVLGEVGRDVAAAVRADFDMGLRHYFGVTPQTWLMDAQNASIAW